VEGLVGHMEVYLTGSSLFWSAAHADLSVITLGEYLMRQNRLLVLRSQSLGMIDQERLDVASAYFDHVLFNRVDEFEQAARQELEVRLIQWNNFLQELYQEKSANIACAPSALEARVIIEDILQKLYLLSCQPESHLVEQIDQVDFTLRQKWQQGKFVWPAEWRSAYPEGIYWWLYGKPKMLRSKLKVASQNFSHFGAPALAAP
jgi:hypothetical protein